MPHRSIDKVLDLTCDWHFITLLLEHSLIKHKIIRNKPQIKLNIRMLKLIPITLLVDLISRLFVITFNHSIKVLKPFLFIGSQSTAIQRRRIILPEQLLPRLPWVSFLFLFLLLELLFFIIIPNPLRTKHLLLLHFLLTVVWLVDFDWFQEPCCRFERVEKNHQVLSVNVHPIVIAQGQSFSGLDVLAFDHVLVVIRPHLRHFVLLLLNELLNRHIRQRWRLLIIVLHPLPNTINSSILLLLIILFLLHLLFFLLITLLLHLIKILNFLLFLFVLHVILLKFLILLFFLWLSVNLTTVLVNFTRVLKSWICQHLAKSIVHFHLCYLLLRTQEFWVVWCLGKSFVDLLFFPILILFDLNWLLLLLTKIIMLKLFFIILILNLFALLVNMFLMTLIYLLIFIVLLLLVVMLFTHFSTLSNFSLYKLNQKVEITYL